MKQMRHPVGQIISKLRNADVELGKGKKVWISISIVIVYFTPRI